LTATHLDAKVILTIRDPERWYASIQQTIFPFLDQLHVDGGPGLPGEVIRGRTFAGRFYDRAPCLVVYAEHNPTVQKTIAPARLLVFDVRQGWGALCAFLGAPIPG
jgi:hypothetical protein